MSMNWPGSKRFDHASSALISDCDRDDARYESDEEAFGPDDCSSDVYKPSQEEGHQSDEDSVGDDDAGLYGQATITAAGSVDSMSAEQSGDEDSLGDGDDDEAPHQKSLVSR